MFQAARSGVQGVNEKSQRARKEAQAASASGRCSGRSLPQPRAPSGRRLAARSRAVMLPCPSSERPHLRKGREEGGERRPGSAPSARSPNPSVRAPPRAPAFPARPATAPAAAARATEPRRTRRSSDRPGRHTARSHRFSLFRLPLSPLSHCLCGGSLISGRTTAAGPVSAPTRARPLAQELPPGPGPLGMWFLLHHLFLENVNSTEIQRDLDRTRGNEPCRQTGYVFIKLTGTLLVLDERSWGKLAPEAFA